MKKLMAFLLVGLLIAGICVSIPANAAEDGTGFADVAADAWYAEAAVYCRDNGLMSGVAADAFAPNTTMTRGMLAAVLYRMEGSPQIDVENPFSDVAEGAWYTNAVLWAQQSGIVSGYGGNRFGTGDPVTREQLANILWRYEESPTPRNSAGFTDQSSISSWAVNGVNWAHETGLMNGKDGNRFDPKGNATRAEVAMILMNANGNGPSTSGENQQSRILIAYFSRLGNTENDNGLDANTSASVVVEEGERRGITELVARMIQERTGGDLHLIETADAYSNDYDEVVDRNHQEVGADTRPALKSSVDLDDYDVIFIGYPVWATTVPAPVLSFLESHDLSGKIVIPFCTHDGYGAGNSYSAVSQASRGATVEQGLALESENVTAAGAEVNAWIAGLELPGAANSDVTQQSQNETPITISIGDLKLNGVLYDSPMARELIARLPQTVTMGGYGGREYYGDAGQEITPVGSGQFRFDNGDITYCPANNSLAIFYSQTNRPNLTMEVFPIGRITSDLSVFDTLNNQIEVTFEGEKK